MKPGSLCCCIDDSKYSGHVNKKAIYTCRALIKKGDIFYKCVFGNIYAVDNGIFLEEVKIICPVPISENASVVIEVPLWLNDFRELDAPTSINIEQIVNFEPNFKIKTNK